MEDEPINQNQPFFPFRLFYIQLVIHIMYAVKLDGVPIAHIQYYMEKTTPLNMKEGEKTEAGLDIIWWLLFRWETSVQYLVEHLTNRVHKLVLLVHLTLMLLTHNAGLGVAG